MSLKVKSASDDDENHNPENIDVFPYGDISQKDIRKFSEQMFELSRAKDIINRSDKSSRTVEAITISFRFLEKLGLDLSNACFCETFAYGAEACCLASAFKLKWSLSIEINEESRAIGWSRLKKLGQWAIDHTEMCISRVQDHLALDSHIAYLDTEHAGNLDEGILLEAFLVASKKLLPGSYLILLTRSLEFDPTDWKVDYVEVILKSRLLNFLYSPTTHSI